MSLQGYVNSQSTRLNSARVHLDRVSDTSADDLQTEKVLVLTTDGRTLMGTLLSCDQLTNVVLSETIERIIRPPDDKEQSTEVSHGLYLIRGRMLQFAAYWMKNLIRKSIGLKYVEE